MNEFDLIQTIVRRARTANRDDCEVSVGDDGAVVSVPNGQQLVVSTDTLNVGRHFLPDVDPAALGHKSLAVSLSDIAAMGATPAWALLNLTLDRQHSNWVQLFAQGFGELARQHQVALIGGDTTQGKLAVTVTVMGLVAQRAAIRRDGASLGQDVWMTGRLGEAALALRAIEAGKGPSSSQNQALHWPQPPMMFASRVGRYASAGIDISDGLIADLTHLCKSSSVSVELDFDRIPAASRKARLAALDGGDEYQLCFTASADYRREIEKCAEQTQTQAVRVGRTVRYSGTEWVRMHQAGQPMILPKRTGYVHFSD